MRVGDFKPRKLDVDEQATTADWPFQINEFSNDKLTQYKRAAALDAGQADKEGDFERGNKRFSGIIKATKKQFANDVKKHKDIKKENVEEMARPVTATPDTLKNVKKLWLYVQRNLTDLASMASFYDNRKELYIEDRLNNLLKTASGQPVKVAFDMAYGFEFRDNILYIPIGVMWQYRGMYTSQTFIQKVMSALDSQAMSHTANSLANPPEVMQRRARRDQERQERYNNAQKASSSEQGDEGEWVAAKGSLKEFAPGDNDGSGGGGDKKSYLLQLADQMYKALYVAKNKMAVKAVKDKIVAAGGRVEIVWNDNGSFNVVMYHPTYFKQGHLISLVGDRGQDVGEAMTPPGEFLNKQERLKAGSKILYKGKIVGTATGEMDGDRVIFKPNENYGSKTTATLPIDQISLREDTTTDINEFAQAPTGPKGPKDYGQPNSSRYIGNGKFVVGTTNNYVLTATVDKWGLEWDEDDEIWFLDSPGAAHIADASEGEIELPPPREQRNQIHDLVTDYLNTHNSADLQKAAAYYGHSDDGEMATEGVRVSGQQIPGTKNRAKTAYYPTNVPPQVKKLDKPLTDKELARLSNQGHVKEFVQTAPIATPTGDTPPSHGFAIKVHGPFGQRQGGIAAVALWEALSAVFPDRYPRRDYQNYGAQLDSPQARVLNQIHRSGSAVVADGLASRDLAETLANKLASFQPDSDLYVNPIGIKHVEVVDQSINEDGGRAVDVNGWTQQDWIQAVKRKFPAAKIIQAKMIDGPCQAVLPNGRTLYWNPVQAMAEGAPRVDSLVTNGLKIMRGPTRDDAIAALKTQVGERDFNERRGFYNFYVRQLMDMYGKKGVAEGKKVDSFVANVKSSEKKAGHSDKEAEDIAWATANKRGMLDNKNKKKVHETIAPITVDEILEGLDADQKRVGQVGGKEKAKKISPVLTTNPKKHPFNKRLVGE